jgi:hypothetical protein
MVGVSLWRLGAPLRTDNIGSRQGQKAANNAGREISGNRITKNSCARLLDLI